MFDTEKIGMYLDDIGHRVMKDKQGDELKVLDLTFRIEPLTPTLAAEIADGVKGVLFRRNDGEMNQNIDRVSFTHKPKPQAIQVFPDPQIGKASLTIDEGKITRLRARKPKDGNLWVFLFRVTTAHLTGADLLYLQEALYTQKFLSFANAATGLFDDEEKAARKTRRRQAEAETQPTLAH